MQHRFQFTIAKLMRVQLAFAGLVAIAGVQYRIGGALLGLFGLATTLSLVGYAVSRSNYGRLTCFIFTIGAGGVGGSMVGRLKFDYPLTVVWGMLIATFLLLGFSLLDDSSDPMVIKSGDDMSPEPSKQD